MHLALFHDDLVPGLFYKRPPLFGIRMIISKSKTGWHVKWPIFSLFRILLHYFPLSGSCPVYIKGKEVLSTGA